MTGSLFGQWPVDNFWRALRWSHYPVGMRRGTKRILGLALAGALVLSGCSGEDAEGPDETELSLPPVESDDSGGDETGSGSGVLDLGSMSNEELLAEAERTYQGMLRELETVRTSESGDYMQLNQWVTDHFRTVVSDLMDEYLPEGYRAHGTAELLWIQLSTGHASSESEIFANVCLDNTPIRVFDEENADVTNPEANEVSSATVRLVLSDDETRLLVDWERQLEESETRECSLD